MHHIQRCEFGGFNFGSGTLFQRKYTSFVVRTPTSLREFQFGSVQSRSHVRLFAIPWPAARQAVHHQLAEFTQTHVHEVGDAIQPSHLLSSPSPPAFNLSQHQGLFKRVSSTHQVGKVLEFQLQYLSFQ